MQAVFIAILLTTPIIAFCTWLYLRARRGPSSRLKKRLSMIIYLFTCSAAAVTAIATPWWIRIVVSGDAWTALAFGFIGSGLGAGSFFFAFVPSVLFYSHWRSERDLHSLWVSGSTVIALVVEIVSLLFVPLHAC